MTKLHPSQPPTHLGLELHEAYEAWLQGFVSAMQRAGHTWYTPVRANLMAYIPREGCKQSELLLRTGHTKQALQQLLDGLERAEVIKRAIDPEDKRGRVVRFTPIGFAALADGDALKATLEDRAATILGDGDLQALRGLLQRLSADWPSTDNAGQAD